MRRHAACQPAEALPCQLRLRHPPAPLQYKWRLVDLALRGLRLLRDTHRLSRHLVRARPGMPPRRLCVWLTAVADCLCRAWA